MSEKQNWPELVFAVAKSRDKYAFGLIFDYFAPRLENYLRRLGLDAGSAEEVCQDAMAALWHKAHMFDPAKSSLATWLYRVARNRRIDISRRDRLNFYDPTESHHFQSADQVQGSDTLFHEQYLEEKTQQALKQLPENQSELIELSFYQGLSHSEIAKKTGLPLGTVKSRIRLAFTRLRRILESEGIVETSI